MTRAQRPGLRALWFPAVVGACVALGSAGAFRMVPSPDVSWLLLAASRWLDGARYGVDVLEVNPPLIVWMYAPAVLLARLTGIPAHLALAGLTITAALATLIVVARLVAMIEPRWREIVAALLAALLLLPGVDFAQREHLAAILVSAWLALAATRLAGVRVGRGLALTAAFIGATGFLLKPYFLIAWLFVEVAIVRRGGLASVLRTDNRIAVAAGLTYIGAVVLLTPDYLPFMRQTRPLYPVYLTQWPLGAALLCANITVLGVLLLRRENAPPSAIAFGGAALGFAAAAALQMKWFGYHFLPAVTFAVVTGSCLWAARAGDGRRRLPSMVAAVAGAGALLVLLSGALQAANIARRPWSPRFLPEPYLAELRALIETRAPGGTVMALSTNIHSGFPLVPLAGAEWASRLPSLWPLFSVYAGAFWEQTEVQYHPPARRTGLERWFTDVVFEDLQAYRPDLILVLRYHPSATHSGGAHRFDYLAYFGAEPRFREALEAYDRLEDVGRYHVLARKRDRRVTPP